MKKRFAPLYVVSLLVVVSLACGLSGCASTSDWSGEQPESSEDSYELDEDALALPSGPEAEFGGNELEVGYVGRYHILEGDTTWEPAFELIKVDSFDPVTLPREKDGGWHDFNIYLSNSAQKAHKVAFHITCQRLDSGKSFEVNANVWRFDSIEPDTTYVNYSFYDSRAYAETPPIEILGVEIQEIDFQTRDEYIPPGPTDEYYQDVWVLSNPTTQALVLNWELRKRDGRGILLESGGTDCDPDFFFVPPGENVIVHASLSVDEVETGVTYELTTQPLTNSSCSRHMDGYYCGASYDPSVRLVSLERYGKKIVAIIENTGTRKGLGAFYLNVFSEDGTPIYGRSLDLPLRVSGPIPPGEKVEVTMPLASMLGPFSFRNFIEPHVDQLELELVFLGLSE